MRGKQHRASVLLDMPIFGEQPRCDEVSRFAIKTAEEIVEDDERATRIQRPGETLEIQ